MRSRIEDHIAAYKKSAEELVRRGKRKMSTMLNVEHHQAGSDTLCNNNECEWWDRGDVCGIDLEEADYPLYCSKNKGG